MRTRYVLEDLAHEEFTPRLFRRIARDLEIELTEQSTGHAGGAGSTIRAFRQLLADIRVGNVERPDLVVVGIDVDCGQQGNREQQILRACELERYDGPVLTAEPDPHIEIWYLADPEFIQKLLKSPERPTTPTVRCKRQEYKDRLRSAVLSSSARPAFGGIEYGREIAEGMDLYRAGRNVASLKRFVDTATQRCREYQRRGS